MTNLPKQINWTTEQARLRTEYFNGNTGIEWQRDALALIEALRHEVGSTQAKNRFQRAIELGYRFDVRRRNDTLIIDVYLDGESKCFRQSYTLHDHLPGLPADDQLEAAASAVLRMRREGERR
jgi:hypothetical protein